MRPPMRMRVAGQTVAVTATFVTLLVGIMGVLCTALVVPSTSTPPAPNHLSPQQPSLKMAMWQGFVSIGDKEANIAVLSEGARQAASQGARLIMYPELALVGYGNMTVAEVHALAERVDGPSLQRLGQVAKEAGIYMLVGYVERDEHNASIIYDAAALLSPEDGSVILNYRKMQLSGIENDFFTPGQKFADVVEVDGIRVGILICYDISIPETSRIMALKKTSLLLVPTANGFPPEINAIALIQVPSRAVSNFIHVAYCNYAMSNDWSPFHGLSKLYDPMGEALITGATQLDTINIYYADIQPSKYPDPCTILRDRRPATYALLTDPHAYCLP